MNEADDNQLNKKQRSKSESESEEISRLQGQVEELRTQNDGNLATIKDLSTKLADEKEARQMLEESTSTRNKQIEKLQQDNRTLQQENDTLILR